MPQSSKVNAPAQPYDRKIWPQNDALMIDIDAALNSLTAEEKCLLLSGKTTLRTQAFTEAGIPQIKMSDGPNGVRGEGHGGSGTPGVVVPSGITLGATWDPELLEEVGSLL
jgi:beta-glucosidase